MSQNLLEALSNICSFGSINSLFENCFNEAVDLSEATVNVIGASETAVTVIEVEKEVYSFGTPWSSADTALYESENVTTPIMPAEPQGEKLSFTAVKSPIYGPQCMKTDENGLFSDEMGTWLETLLSPPINGS